MSKKSVAAIVFLAAVSVSSVAAGYEMSAWSLNEMWNYVDTWNPSEDPPMFSDESMTPNQRLARSYGGIGPFVVLTGLVGLLFALGWFLAVTLRRSRS